MTGIPWSWTGMQGDKGGVLIRPPRPRLACGGAIVTPDARHMDTYHMTRTVAAVGAGR